MTRLLRSALGVLALALLVACSDDKTNQRMPANPTPSEGGAGSGPTDPASLRVEFEELALEGEPALVTDFVFYPGSDTDFLTLDKSGLLQRYSLGEQSATLVSSAQLAGVYD